MAAKKEFGRMAVGTILAISLCTLVFWGGIHVVYGAEMNRTRAVSSVGDELATSTNQGPEVPQGYAKASYKVTIGKYSDTPTAKDMFKEEAAELGAQDLWRLFGASLEGKAVEMTYVEGSAVQPRAEWRGMVEIDENHSYSFSVDAVTGGRRVTQQSKYWDADLALGMDMSLLKNHEEFDALAREVAEKYLSDAGKVVSVEYGSQGYSSNVAGNSNPDIQMYVKFDTGQEAQISFSRHNKELLYVAYDAWVKDARLFEEQTLKMVAEDEADSMEIVIGQDEDGEVTLVERVNPR